MASGFTYEEAAKAYKVTVSVIEDAIIAGSRVGFGKVGAVIPVVTKARVVNMGFQRVRGGIKHVQREYNIGQRIRWKFSLFRKFEETHNLRWA